ncbi:sulfur carrier protein ThiS [Ideonella livida]|uniref:Sulfur carrier protein ThiS n=1 Tax=Ideonella livida TaxID=2707176 RepID=A0A7C9TKU2_9BURK|nr:sulfur carrier protein ThiS [Ideonella livida]NDY92004.1 sulfur carrier protein ThiS [Ideonella livida]
MTPTLAPITLNGEPQAWAPGLTVAQALAAAGLEQDGVTRVATAVNAQFVPRALRESTVLQAGDALTTFAAIVGG